MSLPFLKLASRQGKFPQTLLCPLQSLPLDQRPELCWASLLCSARFGVSCTHSLKHETIRHVRSVIRRIVQVRIVTPSESEHPQVVINFTPCGCNAVPNTCCQLCSCRQKKCLSILHLFSRQEKQQTSLKDHRNKIPAHKSVYACRPATKKTQQEINGREGHRLRGTFQAVSLWEYSENNSR